MKNKSKRKSDYILKLKTHIEDRCGRPHRHGCRHPHMIYMPSLRWILYSSPYSKGTVHHHHHLKPPHYYR